ncbi:phosphoethanolamine transferase [Nitrosophilus alvini]|uniref:phosphoethanolamine transferase n=1 Tax=Nitrosophilus alvini TaxID=2714855 RepID=UPI00190979FA|nr:phosphoethanolamine transferase [Nitrosophilus alvini]
MNFYNILFSLTSVLLFLVADYLIFGTIFQKEIFLLFLLILCASYMHRYSLFVFLITIFLFSFVGYLFYSYYGRSITINDIVLFTRHTTETFDTFFDRRAVFLKAFVVSGLFFAAMIFAFATLGKKLKKHRMGKLALISVIFIILGGNFKNYSVFLLASSLKDYALIEKEAPYQTNFFSDIEALKEGEANIILVIGESLRYSKMRLFGYEKDTTPGLDRLKNKENFIYKPCISYATSTDVSVPLLLNPIENPKQLRNIRLFSRNLFRLAKKNGYRTYFISSQSQRVIKYMKKFIGMRFIDVFKTCEDMSDGCKFGMMDGKLLEEFKSMDLNKKSFVVLQMSGQHSPYRYYPEEFGRFSEDVLGRYDNSVLYTDYVISEIIKYIENFAKRPTVFIFTSDHGEMLGEKSRWGHNCFEKEVYSVPFVFYTKNLEDKALKEIENAHFMTHYNISELILYYLGYSSSFSPKLTDIYVNGTMITGEDGYIKLENVIID